VIRLLSAPLMLVPPAVALFYIMVVLLQLAVLACTWLLTAPPVAPPLALACFLTVVVIVVRCGGRPILYTWCIYGKKRID